MKRFLAGFLTVILSLGLLVGGAMLLARGEESREAPQIQTEAAPETTQATLPPETTLATEPAQTQPAVAAVTEVPRYYQTDYPYDKFGNGTIATSGCSMTCLAMVATYLTDQEYMPDELAYHFGSFGKNNIERLIYGNEQMQLPNVRTENVQEVLQALREGKVAIVMMDDESIFTSTQHFIVLAGITPEEKVIVNDPLGKTHPQDVYMTAGYADGFGTWDIMRGFSGAWIYDKAAMPEAPFLYDAAKPEQEENRYGGYVFTPEDEYTLASFAWVVAREEPYEVQRAVVEVVLNRVASDQFPNTVWDVLKKGEFYNYTEKMAQAQVDYPQYMAANDAVYGPYVLPPDVYYFSQWEKNGEVWGELGSYTFLYARQKAPS